MRRISSRRVSRWVLDLWMRFPCSERIMSSHERRCTNKLQLRLISEANFLLQGLSQHHLYRNVDGSGANFSMLSVFLPAVFKSSSEHRIPECRRSLVFEAEAAEEELILVNTTKQFHSGNGDRSRGEVLESEHGAGSGLDAAVGHRQLRR